MARGTKTAAAAPEARAGTQWPNINRQFRINNADYAKAYGYWRGNVYGKVAPVEAARKLVAGEKLLRTTVARMDLLGARAAARGPLEFVGLEAEPIKLAGGEPVAQCVLPVHGERATRSLCGLPSHRCRSPAFAEPEPEPAQAAAHFNQSPEEAPPVAGGPAGDHARHSLGRAAGAWQAHASVGCKSHLVKPRSYSEAERPWRPPEYADTMVQSRVWKAAGYTDAMHGSLELMPPRLATSEEEFDRMSVRELLTRSRSVEPGTRQSSRLPSRDQLRSSASRYGTPAWARATRAHSTIIGDPKQKRTCIIRPVTPKEEKDEWVKLPDNWMAKVPNLGRVKDPFCHHLCSEPLYCFDLEQARHGREPHMVSSLGVFRGGPVYNVRATNAIQR